MPLHSPRSSRLRRASWSVGATAVAGLFLVALSAHDSMLVPHAFAVGAGSSIPAAAVPRSDSADVANTVHAYDRALRNGDSTRALGLLAPDAVILESGGVETREDYRAHHLPADIEFARAVPSQGSAVTVRVRGDIAWAWSTSTSQGEYRGRQINSAAAELMVLTRAADGWKIVAIHWSSRQRR